MESTTQKEQRCNRCIHWEPQSNRYGFCLRTEALAPSIVFCHTGEPTVKVLTPRFGVCPMFEPLRAPRTKNLPAEGQDSL